MDTGIASYDLEQIKNVFAANSSVREVILFGSRAMGNYKAGSDIDLAIVSLDDRLKFDDMLDLGIQLEQLGFLYRFDLQYFNQIKNQDMKDHIDRVGMLIYRRDVDKKTAVE